MSINYLETIINELLFTNKICVFQLVFFKISNNKTYFEMKKNVTYELMTQSQWESSWFVPGSMYL